MNNQKIIEQPSMAILIDCWEEIVFGKTASNIVDFCVTNPWIKAVVLASYDDTERNGYLCPTEQPWHDNTRKIFYENAKWMEVRKIWQSATFNRRTRSITSQTLVNMPLVAGQARFQAQDSLWLTYYLNSVDPSIRNIYFLGGGWDQCIKWRPVGWWMTAAMNQSRMLHNKVNILTNEKCIFGDYIIPTFAPPDRAWSRLDHEIWLLNQTKINYFDVTTDPNVPKGYC